jgi:hypothetical protein
MYDIARRGGAQVLVCTPLSNMLVAPTQLAPDRWVEHTGLTPEQLKELGLTLRRAKLLIPERFRGLVESPTHLRVFTWYGAFQDGIQDEPYDAPQLRRLGPPLDAAPADDSGRLSSSVEGAHWPDPQGWGAITRQLMSDMKLLMDRKITPAERTQLEQSAEAYHQVIEMSQGMPEQQFAYATVLWLLGRDEEAVRWFQSARDDDPAPRAASSQIHDAIRRTATARDDVALLDSALLFAAADPNGLPGYEMMMDSCHMQPGVRVALMRELADAIPTLMDR